MEDIFNSFQFFCSHSKLLSGQLFYYMTLRRWVSATRRFERSYCLHLQWACSRTKPLDLDCLPKKKKAQSPFETSGHAPRIAMLKWQVPLISPHFCQMQHVEPTAVPIIAPPPQHIHWTVCIFQLLSQRHVSRSIQKLQSRTESVSTAGKLTALQSDTQCANRGGRQWQSEQNCLTDPQ
jgi:hypothetical protein